MSIFNILFISGLILIIIIAGYLYSCYVNVIKAGNNFMEALSGIDVQLRKRYDLIPNILAIAKKFMEHESAIFSEITKLRTMALEAKPGSKASIAANSQLDSLMGQLLVSVENYPTLKSDQTMIQAMKTYNEVEEHIAAARRFYNSAFTEIRNLANIFPSSLFRNHIAHLIDNNEYFTITDAKVKEPIKANFNE